MAKQLKASFSRTLFASSTIYEVRPMSQFIRRNRPLLAAEQIPKLSKSIDLVSSKLSSRWRAGYGVTSQIRLSHTDLRPPNFDFYRKKESLDPTKSTQSVEDQKKFLMGGVSYFLGISAAYTAKAIVIAHLASMNPSAGVLAMSSTEVNLKDVPEGKQVTVSWRGKPLFVRHRTPEEIKEANEVDITKLRDPQEDKYRVQDPKFLIVIGVCTHLGCIPMPYVGDFNGYYCPCHGSHYDTSARIRKGPAPYNLEVPSYVFLTPTTIRVG